jgi:flagellar biogenesis protein FliO
MTTSLDLAAAAIQSLAALLLVLALMVGVFFWLRRRWGPFGAVVKGQSIRVLATAYLGMRKSICLVDVMGTRLVLGVGRDEVRLLARLKACDAGDPPTVSTGQTFGSRLQHVLGVGGKNSDA